MDLKKLSTEELKELEHQFFHKIEDIRKERWGRLGLEVGEISPDDAESIQARYSFPVMENAYAFKNTVAGFEEPVASFTRIDKKQLRAFAKDPNVTGIWGSNLLAHRNMLGITFRRVLKEPSRVVTTRKVIRGKIK